jgi:hypothetical protein
MLDSAANVKARQPVLPRKLSVLQQVVLRSPSHRVAHIVVEAAG